LQYADDMLAYLGNNLQSALQGLTDNRNSILAEQQHLAQADLAAHDDVVEDVLEAK